MSTQVLLTGLRLQRLKLGLFDQVVESQANAMNREDGDDAEAEPEPAVIDASRHLPYW